MADKEFSLKDIINEDETIAVYAVNGEYFPREFIVPKDKDLEYINIAGCLEDTLHRILEAEGTDGQDVYRIMGASIPTEEELAFREEIYGNREAAEDSLIHIDLGYCLSDDILSIEKQQPEEITDEER